jgi:hypothetical protein
MATTQTTLLVRAFMRSRVAGRTLLVVIGVVLVKLAIAAFALEFISISPLFTSIVGGGVFVLGLLVAGTLADYKEADRVPAEITAVLTNIHDDCSAFKRQFPDLDLVRLKQTLLRIAQSFHDDLADPRSVTALDAIDDLNETFLQMDTIGVPATYTSRLRNEQGSLRRSMLRVYHVQRTEFLPSAFLLIETIVGVIITTMLFMKYKPTYEAVIIIGFISFFFLSLLALLKLMDEPFHVEEHTKDDVSLFLLRGFVERLNRSAS